MWRLAHAASMELGNLLLSRILSTYRSYGAELEQTAPEIDGPHRAACWHLLSKSRADPPSADPP